MTDTKFTPGPWEFYSDDFEKCGVKATNNPAGYKDEDCLYPIASVNGDWRDSPEYGSPFANASLIAAAPDLYQNLAEITKWMERSSNAGGDLLIQAKQALAKARGE